MNGLLIDIAMVLTFVLLGGVFAASEIALVSLRESQIRSLHERGGRGPKVAELASNSNRFLSAVQVGVTLAGFFSASFGAAQIAPRFAPVLAGWGAPEGLASGGAFVLITLLIAYLSLVLGELAPKRLALQNAEGLALIVSGPLDTLAKLLRPMIWLLSASTDVVVRVAGGDPKAQREEMDVDELRSLVAGHEGIDLDQRRMVIDLLAAGERSVQEIMTPRTEVDFLNASTPVTEARMMVRELGRSRYPVIGSNTDHIVGYVHVLDLLTPAATPRRVGALARQVTLFPTGKQVLAALAEMRSANVHMAVVVDEYGGTDGILTLEDVIEEFIGEIEDEYDEPRPDSPEQPGVEDVEGLLNRAGVTRLLGIELPEGPFDTLGGFLMAELERVPEAGDAIEALGRRFTVQEMDGRRIERVTVEVLPWALDAGDDEVDDGADHGVGEGGVDDRAAPGATETLAADVGQAVNRIDRGPATEGSRRGERSASGTGEADTHRPEADAADRADGRRR